MQTNSIPEKAARKQAEICAALIAETAAAVENGTPADKTLKTIYKQHREFGSRDRRFFSNTVFSYFRWLGWLPENNIGISQINCVIASLLDSDYIHPAVNIMINELGLQDARPLGNLPLAEKAAEAARLSGSRKPFSPLSLVPPWFIDEIPNKTEQDSGKQMEACIEALQSRPPAWLRLSKTLTPEAIAALKQALPPFRECESLPQAVGVETNIDINSLPNSTKGKVEIQDLSSQCVAIACDPKPGHSWWDVCAGSGGKALHIADIMNNKGHILATDTRSNIIPELERRIKKSGLHIIKNKTWNGTNDPAPNNMFDGVLVDAPCSGSGTWHRNPDARWRTTHESLKDYIDIQKKILELAASKVRPQGFLVYSVCSLFISETEHVVEKFLSTNTNFELIPLNNPLTGETTPGMFHISPETHSCNGMFIAKMKKNDFFDKTP